MLAFMKKIESFTGKAKKLIGPGHIEYCLWVDEGGGLYVQMLHNDASGTFSNLAFPVSRYANNRNLSESLSNLEAFELDSKKSTTVLDNNNGAFLKAVLRDLLPN